MEIKTTKNPTHSLVEQNIDFLFITLCKKSQNICIEKGPSRQKARADAQVHSPVQLSLIPTIPSLQRASIQAAGA